jgi:hypothetical protein
VDTSQGSFEGSSGWLAPQALQNPATVGMISLQLGQAFTSTPEGGSRPPRGHRLMSTGIRVPQCMQYRFFSTKISVVLASSRPRAVAETWTYPSSMEDTSGALTDVWPSLIMTGRLTLPLVAVNGTSVFWGGFHRFPVLVQQLNGDGGRRPPICEELGQIHRDPERRGPRGLLPGLPPQKEERRHCCDSTHRDSDGSEGQLASLKGNDTWASASSAPFNEGGNRFIHLLDACSVSDVIL